MSEQFITKRDEVKALLRKLFRSEDADLDFGIYRIMNYKRREIEQFIERDLIETAEAEFKQYARAGTADLEKELEQLRAEINSDFGTGTIDTEGRVTRNHDAPKIQRYFRTQEEYREAALTEEQVNDVFNHVLEFFSRYYYDGDFITRPKDSWQSKYSIPYKGEEVTLHWATKNMYYIKTGEFFKKYSFKAGRYRVNFVIINAQVETGNAKSEKKFFILLDEEPVQIDETVREVDIKFNYRKFTDAEKAKYGTRNIQATLVSETLEKMGPLLEQSSIVGILRPRGGEDKSLMEKHLNAYVDRNTKDFFIHKDLKGFFERELDFYLKNEVWSLDELESSSESGARLLAAKVKTIRGISLKIIEFLSQIEKFQKRLFEKKKFVLKTDYCITLDLIPVDFYEEIGRNEKQVEEWKEIYKLDEITNGNFYSTKGKTTLTVDFLKQYKYMALDTKFFPPEFKDKLLETFDNLDDIINGLIIKSDNFHALNLINNNYKEAIKCCYIDPPYNTGGDEFLYKDNYQHSSWLSMQENRINKMLPLFSQDGVLFVSIGQDEIGNLKALCDGIFGGHNRIGIISRVMKTGGSKGTFFSPNIDYVLVYAKLKEFVKPFREKISDDLIKKVYTRVETEGEREGEKYRVMGLYQAGLDIRPNQRYWIRCPDGTYVIPPGITYPKNVLEGEKVVPQNNDGVWSRIYDRYQTELDKNNIEFIKTGTSPLIDENRKQSKWNIYYKIWLSDRIKSGRVPVDIITKYENRHSSAELKDFDITYSFAKPIGLIKHLISIQESQKDETIIDFFAGSGTTAHAVLNLNYEDGGARKYILVEMEEYFDSILIPRIKKVVFSKDWKKGIPLNTNGMSNIFKYIYIEQYEDTLNNIVFISPDGTIQKTLERFSDYFVSYMLDYKTRDSPTRLSIEQFKTPFNYKIKTLSGGEEREEPIDLVETFNYLLGLHIRRIHTYEDGDRFYRAVFGERDHEQVAVIWRDTSGLDFRRDKSFIEKNILIDSTFNTIYVNGDSYVRNAKPIEPEFRRLMDA